MKKILAGIAVLAVAAAAQADLLATWNAATVDNKTTEAEMSDLYAINGATGNGTYGKLLMNDISEYPEEEVLEQGAFGFDVTLASGGFIADAILAGSTTGSATGPGHVFITGGSQDADFTRTRTGTFEENLGTLANGAVVKFTADLASGAGTARSSTETFTNVQGTLGIKTMSLSGTVSAVPEPATMSLLGLGALAMVIRRKLSK